MSSTAEAVPVALALIGCVAASAQQGPQPLTYTASQTATPPVQASPGPQVPQSQQSNASPDAALPQPDGSSMDLRAVKPMVIQPACSSQPSQATQQFQSMRHTPEVKPRLRSRAASCIRLQRIGQPMLLRCRPVQRPDSQVWYAVESSTSHCTTRWRSPSKIISMWSWTATAWDLLTRI